jgi:hypothetical protein
MRGPQTKQFWKQIHGNNVLSSQSPLYMFIKEIRNGKENSFSTNRHAKI